jgi:predicted Zn-dependent protease
MGQVKEIKFLSDLVGSVMDIRVQEKNNGTRRSLNPFFVLLEMSRNNLYEIEASNGCLARSYRPNNNLMANLRSEIRIGNYSLGSQSFQSMTIPSSMDEYTSKSDFFNTMNQTFWNAVRDFDDRSSDSAGIIDQKQSAFLKFSKERPVVYTPRLDELKLDKKYIERWEHDLVKASRSLMNKQILTSGIEMYIDQSERFLVNSEGTKIASNYSRYEIIITAIVADRSGRILELSNAFHVLSPEDVPSLDELTRSAEDLVKNSLELRIAPIQEPGIFPVILDQVNHGVLWHEAIGHSLEGHRVGPDDEEGAVKEVSKSETFKGKIGKMVAPEFISVFDDPTIPGLDGSYEYDREGVKSRRVALIKNGVLKNYLTTRDTAAKLGKKSNGHARCSGVNEITPRMSNLVIKSENQYPVEQLKEMLIRECEKQRKDYGLIFKDTIGGVTLTEESYFNVFPRYVLQMDKHGNIKRVRGVYQIGTPYTILANIIATSDDMQVMRGTCGAESGKVPSTETAPHALINSVEIARFPNKSYGRVSRRVFPVLDPIRYK